MIERWIRFWDRREAPTSLALVRILVSLVLLWDLSEAGIRGAVLATWAPPPQGAGWGALQSPPLVVAWLGAGAGTAKLVWSSALLGALLSLLGIAYRFSSWFFVFAMVELHGLTPDGDGVDALLRIVLPLLALSGAGSAYSVDAWWKQRRGAAERETWAWPRYLLFVQLLWLYFSAGHHRGNASWGPGGGFAAVGNVLSDPHYARFSPGALAAFYPLTQLGTLFTMVFELSAPLALLWTFLDRNPARGGRLGHWVRKLKIRWLWLSLGVMLHLGIALTMQLGIFPFGMLALYPAFIAPEEFEAFFRRHSDS